MGVAAPKILPRPILFYIIQSDEKVPARSRFFDAKFDGFWLFSQKVLRIQKRYIPHLKALISSFYEPEAQGTWPAHMMATSS